MKRKSFHSHRHFQIREDIKLPQKEDDDGVLLMFEGGNPVYFKTLDCDLTVEETESIFNVGSFLEEKFEKHVDAYVVCKSHCNVSVSKSGNYRGNIRIFFSFLATTDGEQIIERLESKVKNGEKFNMEDSFDHILLPYMGYKNKEDFEEKYRHYMNCINSYDGIKEVQS